MDSEEYRQRFLSEHPGLLERIEREVSAWPPMSDYAIGLCRAARDAYARKLSEESSRKTS